MLSASGCKDKDSDTKDSDTKDSQIYDASLDAFGCEQECALEKYSACTCGTDDPCGWRADGTCDRKCLFSGIVETMFDDSEDCPGKCDGACTAGLYSACSCGEDDPCGWAGDGYCDISCIDDAHTSVMFDDSADCADAGD